jgi:phenylalanyl-tRNA synthetase beta chain
MAKYLEPDRLTPEEAEKALMDAGLPIETTEAVGDGDTRLDVEVTSNRGDCLSQYGLAREIAAKTGRALRRSENPRVVIEETATSSLLSLENREPGVCPRFTARVIRGVRVGPSPAWLREALEAVGQRSINNVVDVTNYVNFELGQPCHAFDLGKLGGKKIVVRYAREREELTTLDGKKRVLRADELVVADGERAQGLAGVMGGQDSEVSSSTTEVVLEVATWDPATVRRAARRHGLRTDASYRYERIVDARTVDAAAERAAALLAEVSGGRVCAGVLVAGAALEPLREVRLRPSRCRAILGVAVEVGEMARILSALEIEARPSGRAGEELVCTIPAHRPDLEREIDLIEEVARIRGLDAIPMHDRVAVAVRSPQNSERAKREISSLLVGMGYYETVTFSFCRRSSAKMFMPAGLEVVEVDDERRKEEPALRPSVLTGLLECRARNANAHSAAAGSVRLFEVASVYAQRAGSRETVEHRNVGILMDVAMRGKSATTGELQVGVRALRASVEAVVRAAAGSGARLEFEPGAAHCAGLEAGAYAEVTLNGARLGYVALASRAALAEFGLEAPVAVAELNLETLIEGYPPRARVAGLPAFPSIERDVSFIVGEDVTWSRLSGAIGKMGVSRLEQWGFVGAYRGPQIGKGKKSVTVRLRFRDGERTLRHDEIDAPVETIVGKVKAELGAEVRG